MFEESQHIVLQKFQIRHDQILSIRQISETMSDFVEFDIRHIPILRIDNVTAASHHTSQSCDCGGSKSTENLTDAWIKLYRIWGGNTAVRGTQQVLDFRQLAPF